VADDEGRGPVWDGRAQTGMVGTGGADSEMATLREPVDVTDDFEEDRDRMEADFEGIDGKAEILARPQDMRLDCLIGSGSAGNTTSGGLSACGDGGKSMDTGTLVSLREDDRLSALDAAAASKTVSMLGMLGVELILEGRYRDLSSPLSLLPDSSLPEPGLSRPSLSRASDGPASGEDLRGRDSRRGECEVVCRRMKSGLPSGRGATKECREGMSGKILPGV